MRIVFCLIVATVFGSFGGNSIGIRRYPDDLYENDPCGLDVSIYSGKCKKIKQCTNLFVEKKDIEICSFIGNDGESTLVCCSREDFYKSRNHFAMGSLDYNTCQEKYKDYRQHVSEEQELQNYVINGVDIEPYEFTHIAAIGWLQWDDLSVAWHCGGALITESYIVTAAHCSRFNGRMPNVARLGDTDLHSMDDDYFVQQFGILNITIHPSYQFSMHDFDIALIKLKGRVVPTIHVCPICIGKNEPSTEYFEAAGYGQDENGLKNSKLAKVYIKKVEHETCQSSYSTLELRTHHVCAQHYREDLPIQDTCYGDSGSPMQFIDNSYIDDGKIYQTPTLVGLTSFGIGCGFGYPSVYTNASYFFDWMESVIGEDN